MVAKKSQIGADGVNRIFTLALTSMTAGINIRYVDRNEANTIHWCGINGAVTTVALQLEVAP